MASFSSTHNFLLSLALLLVTLHKTLAGDADILTDYTVPLNSTIDGNYFTYTGLRSFIGATPPTFKVFKASMAELPSLNGQSVSFAALYYPPGTVNPLHTHPRASELLFLVIGTLNVGFVSNTNELYNQTLQAGDMFVFPKGLVHYQYNSDGKIPAIAVSAFGSASAGIVSIPTTVFNTSISDMVLTESFKTDVGTVEKLKSGLTHLGA